MASAMPLAVLTLQLVSAHQVLPLEVLVLLLDRLTQPQLPPHHVRPLVSLVMTQQSIVDGQVGSLRRVHIRQSRTDTVTCA
jgi:hypothetical protein